MGKNKYFIISGLILKDNNRGTSALGYGAISFLREKKRIDNQSILLKINIVRNIFKKDFLKLRFGKMYIQGNDLSTLTINVSLIEYILAEKLGVIIPFTPFGKVFKDIEYIAAINGGDGFSDIYNTRSFKERLTYINLGVKLNIPIIFLPQTLGPFSIDTNKKIAHNLLRKASQIYVRDEVYVNELQKMNLAYELTKDLSFYMKPEAFNIEIKGKPIGINVSGLAYFNNFRTLSGQFKYYPQLLMTLIEELKNKGYDIYLIPHSYNANIPEKFNDDLLACKDLFKTLSEKSHVHVIDKDMIAPQVKYVISKMLYFIGTRMHANFAAIYTNVPLYGLAYSYKFEGAFRANNVYDNNISMINNIVKEDINKIVSLVLDDLTAKIRE